MKTKDKKYNSVVKKIDAKCPGALNTMLEMLEAEHVSGCDSSTCDINVAYKNGYGIHALECFLHSGAASEELCELSDKLNSKAFSEASRMEADDLCKTVPHVSCNHCNAVLWGDGDDHCYHCGSCNNTVEYDQDALETPLYKAIQATLVKLKCIPAKDHLSTHEVMKTALKVFRETGHLKTLTDKQKLADQTDPLN